VDSLGGAAKLWTTPQSHDTAAGNAERVGRFGTEHGGANLTDDVTLWSTPQARDTHHPSEPDSEKLAEGWTIDLNEQAAWHDTEAQAEQLWQTPATDSFRSRGGDRKDEMGLDQQARIQWATPNSRDYKSESGGEAIQSHMEDHSPNLSKQVVYSHQDQATEQDGQPSSEKPRGSRRGNWPMSAQMKPRAATRMSTEP
jgi:hypothetical protein